MRLSILTATEQEKITNRNEQTMTMSGIVWKYIGEGSNGTMLDLNYLYTSLPLWISHLEYIPWLWAMFGSILVGLSGVLPLLVIHIDQTKDLKQGG